MRAVVKRKDYGSLSGDVLRKGRVDVPVEAEMAGLAHRFEVLRDAAERQAVAQVGGCKHNQPTLEDTGLPVLMAASASVRRRSYGVALTDALAPATSAPVPYPAREPNP